MVDTKILTKEDGGEVSEVIGKLKGKSFTCGACQPKNIKYTKKLEKFLGYPHDTGLSDKEGCKWWLIGVCPECGYQYSYVELLDKLRDNRLVRVQNE